MKGQGKVSNTKTVVPALSGEQSLNRYLAEIKKFPILTPEQEYMLAKRYAEHEDPDAAAQLVTSHLRLVAKIAMGYRGYGLPVSDLISEGNVGLMQGVKKFEPDRGFRLATYAMWWIKASIQEFILRSWSLVKMGTTAAQKKLFFNLRRMKKELEAYEDADLHPDDVTKIATDLGVPEQEVINMNRRMMMGGDGSLNVTMRGAEEGSGEWQDWLKDDRPLQDETTADAQEATIRHEMLVEAMDSLNEREKHILTERRLTDDPQTLEELSQVYDVSRERIRQIEVRAFEKLQKAMQRIAGERLLPAPRRRVTPQTNEAALIELLAALQRRGYAFVTPTPATHARVIARPERTPARDLAGLLGWNLPFDEGSIDAEIVGHLRLANALEAAPGGRLRAAIRVSSLGGRLYLHAGFPTEAEDAVFFGPDSYRFARLIADELAGRSAGVRSVVDIGTGAGVGAIAAADCCPGARIVGTDINPKALEFARVNSAHAGVALETALGGTLEPVDERFDLILANPPYMADDGARAYRDGGEMIGGQLSLEMARQALPRLNPGGQLILYTGSAIVDGRDQLGLSLTELAQSRGAELSYSELDPDVFGEELDKPAYRTVDRIAVVAAVFTAPLGSD